MPMLRLPTTTASTLHECRERASARLSLSVVDRSIAHQVSWQLTTRLLACLSLSACVCVCDVTVKVSGACILSGKILDFLAKKVQRNRQLM